MTSSAMITPLTTYRNESPYPFCPGCGHGPILDHLNAAFVKLDLDPRQVVLVSDIGCVGLSDQYFATNAFHGLHGRSVTYACGVKLARPDLEVVVLMGDGGTGIGGTHLINAARRNIGVTVLVFNNMNFGMTGGQHSSTTPLGAATSTTPDGNLEAPLDICGTVAVNGAGYVYRGTSFDEDLPDRIAEAMQAPGFALLDIWELCTAYFVPRNHFTRKDLHATLERLGLSPGLVQKKQVVDYADAYRSANPLIESPTLEALGLGPEGLAEEFESALEQSFQLVVAGSAGQKVRSAVRLLGQAGILSGLWAAQRDDYPVTIQTGHSLSELTLSREAFEYSGVERPDALVILSEDGLKKSKRYLTAMEAGDRVFVLPELAGLETRASVEVIDPKRASIRLTPHNRALVTVASAAASLRLVPAAALERAARRGSASYVEANVEAIGAGFALG
jgi:pyruvate/2-oxoacid:ferredoxin oxidoreductase beta subunit/Pyruvate/2-oxoacid:ferredoxin oxidoreductase gamma subunit